MAILKLYRDRLGQKRVWNAAPVIVGVIHNKNGDHRKIHSSYVHSKLPL